MIPGHYEQVQEFEHFLGDSADPGARVHHDRQVRADELGEFPLEAVAAAREFGFADHLVPVTLGGKLRSYEELMAMCRVLARRDLTAAVAFGTMMLGLVPVWLWGDEPQQNLLADLVRGGGLGSFGMSEAEHGSDLLASELVAEPVAGGFLVSGTKWPIGNATRGQFVTVFARTGSKAGPRGFSLLMIDKRTLPATGWSNEPKVSTLGLRGHDLSGITFRRCFVPDSSLVGGLGTGIDHTLKALQVTRTLVPALTLGATDVALRVTARYARDRKLYGSPVSELPVVREQLVSAHLDQLIAECVALLACRALGLAPERMSLWSSVAKYLVPVLGEEIFAATAKILSARFYLREGVAGGIFQKMLRDSAITGVFEGTTHVVLSAIAGQLPQVLQPGPEPSEELLARLFALGQEAAVDVQPAASLQLTNRGFDEITRGWPSALRALRAVAGASPGTLGEVAAAADELDQVWVAFRAGVADAVGQDGSLHTTARGHALAHTFCLLFAGAACLHRWRHDRSRSGGRFAVDAWLRACLERILVRVHRRVTLSPVAVAETESAVFGGLAEKRTFSLIPLSSGGTA